jgi:hypothetical protein
VPNLNLNFQFVSSAQSLSSSVNNLETLGEDFARMIVNEVALAASKDSFQKARTRFVSSVKAGIRAEVSRMALLIGRFLPLPDKYTGPNGQMSLGGMSATAHRFNFQETFNRSQTNIDWAKRSKKYLAWKRRSAFNTGKWWELRGDLKNAMAAKGADFYEESFGPIRVRLERPVGRVNGKFARVNPLPGSALNPTVAMADGAEAVPARGQVNVTAASSRGRASAEVTVGTLKVDVFGKITPSMLPGLANMDPRKADSFPGEGVVGLFPNDGPGGIRNKLLGTRKGRHHRYAVEPFVSFFLMRAIPNAVWRRTEQLVRGSVSVRSNNDGGLNANFAR